MVSPWVVSTGEAVGEAAVTVARRMGEKAPEGAAEITAPAQRVLTALHTGKSPTRRDVEAIAGASDTTLSYLGFAPEQIEAISSAQRAQPG